MAGLAVPILVALFPRALGRDENPVQDRGKNHGDEKEIDDNGGTHRRTPRFESEESIGVLPASKISNFCNSYILYHSVAFPHRSRKRP